MSVEARKRKSHHKAAARKAVSRLPRLSLTASVTQMKSGSAADVAVAFGGVDRVDFVLEPRGVLTMDVASLEVDGSVRLLGKKDGIGTLIASGVRRGKIVIQRMVHVAVEGPLLKIRAFGYKPQGV